MIDPDTIAEQINSGAEWVGRVAAASAHFAVHIAEHVGRLVDDVVVDALAVAEAAEAFFEATQDDIETPSDPERDD